MGVLTMTDEFNLDDIDENFSAVRPEDVENMKVSRDKLKILIREEEKLIRGGIGSKDRLDEMNTELQRLETAIRVFE